VKNMKIRISMMSNQSKSMSFKNPQEFFYLYWRILFKKNFRKMKLILIKKKFTICCKEGKTIDWKLKWKNSNRKTKQYLKNQSSIRKN